MLKLKNYSKIIPLLLTISIFFTACDVPDISEFTAQSAEMTRGIRQGIKDTGDALKTAAANKDLFGPGTPNDFTKHSKNYNTVMQPTLDTLDALDSYVEALNALAQANKKSAENSKALVGAFNNLVSSASKLVVAPPAAAFELPDMALKIGTGVLATVENFRTAKSFKKRVNAAAEIVEGRYDEREEIVSDKKVTMRTKICTDDKKAAIEKIGRDFAVAQTNKIKEIEGSDKYKTLTKQLKEEKDPDKKKIKEKEIKEFLKNSLKDFLKATEVETQNKIKEHGCGIIDLLTFTMQDLRRINEDVSRLIVNNFQAKNNTTFKLFEEIDQYHSNVQQEVTFILEYKTALSSIKKLNFRLKEAQTNNNSNEVKEITRRITNLKANARDKLDSIYVYDSQVQVDISSEIAKCGGNTKCAGMNDYLTCTKCLDDDDLYDQIIIKISPDKFDYGSGSIEKILNARAVDLLGENRDYLIERERIKPDYIRVNAELEALRQSQKKLDKLLTSSIAALKTWLETHANLRDTVNTKKPLSVAVLTAKVKDIWAVLEPQETE